MGKDDGFYTFPRAQILRVIKENKLGLTKEKIASLTGINRTSVLHHLKILKKRNLVKISKRKKGRGNRGCPTLVTLTSKADPQTKGVLDFFEKLFSVFNQTN